MKKLMLMFSFVLVAGLASAQSCDKSSKACAKKCSKTEKTASVETDATQVASALAEAEIAAEANEAITKRVCEKSGAVSFVQKNVCSASGKISYDEVEYCTKSKAFSSVASASASSDIVPMEAADKPATIAKKACCAGGSKKACSKKAKAQ